MIDYHEQTFDKNGTSSQALRIVLFILLNWHEVEMCGTIFKESYESEGRVCKTVGEHPMWKECEICPHTAS